MLSALLRPTPDLVARLWGRLSPLPGGAWFFSLFLGWMIPYTGSVRPRVHALEPGNVEVRMADRRAVRNHLRSVHALALANVGELASGLAVAADMPEGWRFIPVGLEIDYRKKARGEITARCSWRVPEPLEAGEHQVPVTLTNAAGETVAEVRVRTRLDPGKA